MSTPAAYFDEQYARAADPWHLDERWYDRRKYLLTVAALPRPRYERAFEPGCSVGVLTELLAGRCDHLLSTDRAVSAVETTARRTAGLDHVDVRRMTVPEEWPEQTFDLVVLSELLYYFDEAARTRLLRRSVASLAAGGHLVTVHWNHPVAEHTCTGREIADRLDTPAGLGMARETGQEEGPDAGPGAGGPGRGQSPGLSLSRLARYDDPDFTLTVHEHVPDGGAALSPAQAEGLA